MLGAVIFVLPTPTSASTRVPVLDWVSEVSVSLDHKFGTVYLALREPNMDFGQFKRLLKTLKAFLFETAEHY